MNTNTHTQSKSDTSALIDRLLADCFAPVHPGAIEAFTSVVRALAIYEGIVLAFPDARFTPQWRVVEGGRAALGGIMTGTHLGTWRGVEPTSRRIEVLGTLMVECADGQVVDLMVVPDTLAVAEQIGVVPQLGPKACELVDEKSAAAPAPQTGVPRVKWC